MLARTRHQGRIPGDAQRARARYPRIWQIAVRRIAGRPRFLSIDDDAVPVGMCDRRRRHGRSRQNQRQNRSLTALAVAALLLFSACHKERLLPPEQLYQTVRATFLLGDLVSAHREAENAVKRFSADGGEWAWKFRLLDADIL